MKGGLIYPERTEPVAQPPATAPNGAVLTWNATLRKWEVASPGAASHTHAPSEITGTAVVTTDSRLSDARTPTAHSHAASEVSSGRLALAQMPAAAAGFRRWSNAALSIAVVAGDLIEIKMVCPAWATNPANVVLAASIYIE